MVPAAAGVELADQLEQTRGGGVEVGGELGDLVAETIQFSDRFRGRDTCRFLASIDPVPLAGGATVHPGFGPIWERQGQEISGRAMAFRYERPLTGVVGLALLAQAEFVGTAGAREVRLRNRVKGKIRGLPTTYALILSRASNRIHRRLQLLKVCEDVDPLMPGTDTTGRHRR
jgi:hypothetical protein